MLERYFGLRERGTTVGREVRGGVATFLTMAYILLVNPQILSAGGVPQQSAVVCTAAAAGICCLLMGLWANFPLALASGMGLNAVVAFQIVPLIVQEGIAPQADAWKVAMGVVVLDGLIVLALVLTGLRAAVMDAIPRDLRRAIGAGIGLFIAFIGMQNAGLVTGNPATLVTHGSLRETGTLVALATLIIMAVLVARGVKGALLIGIAFGTVLALVTKLTSWNVTHSGPDFSAAFHADVPRALNVKLLPILFAILMVDFFDTLGTATAIADQAGLVDADGRVLNVNRVLVVDSVSASVGGAFGASSVTAYIESASGVAEGARTGLHTVVVGLLFLAAIFLAPLAGIVPKQATAPALILVGFLMISQIAKVDFDDAEQAIPAFITLIGIPLTYSIAHGIGLGFITYVVIKSIALKFRDVHPLMYTVAAAFTAYFVFG